MQVTLVGTNLEIEPLKKALLEGDTSYLLSPEPIAAAYARISRSEKEVSALRDEARADVDKARRSNRSIVFEMGHSSIAEHAVFNFDLEGVSRLAIEAVEHSRLASYTERSQRYVLMGRDYVVPDELEGAARERFEHVVQGLFAGYEDFYEQLLAHHLEAAGGREKISRSERRELAIAAKEDARYLLPLATAGQLGMTVNARTLEAMVRRLKGSPLAEVRTLGRRLEEAALEVTPSLVRYTDPTECGSLVRPRTLPWESVARTQAAATEVELLQHSENPDALIGLLARECAGAGSEEPVVGAARFVDRYYNEATPHTPAPRLFEAVEFLFRVTCSASCFGQLKRHRMATILPAGYDPALGVRVPPSVAGAGLTEPFLARAHEATVAAAALREGEGAVADYLLTNGHCRAVVVKLNLRELYHFTRLRMDSHAQWEIREVAGRMRTLAQEVAPVGGRYLGPKGSFRDAP